MKDYMDNCAVRVLAITYKLPLNVNSDSMTPCHISCFLSVTTHKQGLVWLHKIKPSEMLSKAMTAEAQILQI